MFDVIKYIVSLDVWKMYEPYIVSILLGGLVGIEREFKKQREGIPTFGGIRTFMLISLLGTITADVSHLYSHWIIVGSVISLTILLIVAQYMKRIVELTSIVSAIITYFVGILCYDGNYQMAAVIAIAVFFILTFKEQMHNFVRHLSIEDLYALLKFTAVTIVIYPLLPSRNIAILENINLREVWSMVVLISTVNFVGYVLTKVIGSKKGILATGIIGGLVSSTAVSATFSPLSRENVSLLSEYSAGIIGASSVMFLRMLVVSSIISLSFSKGLLLPCAFAFLLGSVVAYRLSKQREIKGNGVKVENPYELSTALKFGLFYGFILFLSKLSVKSLGSYGLFSIAAISGLADVDAITLSSIRLFQLNEISLTTGIETVLIAATVNTIFKWILTLIMGDRKFFRLSSLGFLSLLIGEFIGFLATIV